MKKKLPLELIPSCIIGLMISYQTYLISSIMGIAFGSIVAIVHVLMWSYNDVVLNKYEVTK